MKNIAKIAAIAFATGALISCGGSKDQDHGHDMVDSTSVAVKDTTPVTVDDTTKFKFDYVIANIPSPANMLNDFKSYKAGYNRAILLDVEKAPSVPGDMHKSYYLGALNMDMGYAMTHQVGVDVIKFVKGVVLLSDQLGLSSSINAMVGKRAENNMNNPDSIYKIMDDIFVKSDEYLRTNKRVFTAANIFIGSWIEANYLNYKLYDDIRTPELKQKARRVLWEQRMHLNNIITLMSDFKNERENMDMVEVLKTLNKKITEIKTIDDMTEEKFKKIGSEIETLRMRVSM